MPRASPAVRNASQFLVVRTARSSWSARTDPSRAHNASRRSMAADRPIVYRDAALADGAGPSLRKGVSVLVRDRRIVWIRPTSDEGTLPRDVRIIDAGGSTIVPGMVDAHSHLTLPGGSHWIDRGADPPEELLEVAEHNGDLLGRAGVRWARDVGSPLAVDPRDGRRRALALRVRERWRSDSARPRVRVAGTWISHSGVLTGGLLIEADDGPALLKAASTQLDDGADFLQLYLDGPKKGEAPWSAEGVRIATGTDFGGGSLRANHLAWEVEALVEAGLKPAEALTSATIRGGELLGEAEAGRIVEGGPADFFLVHGDPLSDASALWRVWKVAWLP